MEFITENTNTLTPLLYKAVQQHGISQTSRNGNVIRLPGVTTCCLTKPWQRVNFCAERDANPFFHFIESMAMLAGLNDVKLMSFFAKNMANFSDNGLTYNAFYGTRARVTWGDQLDLVIKELHAKPDSRQAVVLLWDPADLLRETKDKACNLCLIFQVTPEGKLNMTTFNRSNDLIWGYGSGANVVHLSFFMEYVACALGLPMGEWWHSSANAHVYVDNPQWLKVQNLPDSNVYSSEVMEHRRLFEDRATFDRELRSFLVRLQMACCEGRGDLLWPDPWKEFKSPYIITACFIAQSYIRHKEGTTTDTPQDTATRTAHRIASAIPLDDWNLACTAWLERRMSKEEQQ